MFRRNESTVNLEAAVATLLRAQAQFVSEMANINRRYNELKEESDHRYAQILAALMRHEELLMRLPDAIKDKIGFKPQ
jgi:hypothetical protein